MSELYEPREPNYVGATAPAVFTGLATAVVAIVADDVFDFSGLQA